jgi:2'-5' RNA ligase
MESSSSNVDARRAGPRRRIFLAVPLARGLQEGVVSAIQEAVGEHDALRWVRPDMLHVTLRFLGGITAAELNRAIRAAQAAADPFDPFPVTFAGGGAFPSLRTPRVVWAGVGDGAGSLRALAEALDAALAKQRFPREPQRFHPHVTVARGRAGGPPPDLRPYAGRLMGAEAPVIGTQRVDAIVVMESMLHPSGARYEEIYRAAFGGGPSHG